MAGDSDSSRAGSPADQPGTDEVDFVLAAYREDGRWQVEPLPPWAGADLDTLVEALRARPGDHGALGMVSIDEDFFVAVRVVGAQVRLLLSDVTAATEWPLARQVLDQLELPLPDEDDPVQPAGDLALLADLGLDAMALGAICDDPDLYPEEMLGEVAARLGFGDEYDAAVESSLG